jgi:hypothetical protein
VRKGTENLGLPVAWEGSEEHIVVDYSSEPALYPLQEDVGVGGVVVETGCVFGVVPAVDEGFLLVWEPEKFC